MRLPHDLFYSKYLPNDKENLNFSNKVSKKFSRPDKKFAADVTYGILASGDCLLTDIVEQLHEGSKKANSVERPPGTCTRAFPQRS